MKYLVHSVRGAALAAAIGRDALLPLAMPKLGPSDF